MVRNILIPTDGSGYARTAVAYGIYLAQKLGARLTGLHVVDLRLMQTPAFSDISCAAGLLPCGGFPPAVESGLEAKAESALEAFRRQCDAGGIPAGTKKVVGLIDEAIIEEGKAFDWILLAQRGEHFRIDGGAILGSTTQSVVRRSEQPVLVAPGHFTEIESMALAYDGSGPARRALALAGELSDRAGWPLSIVVVADDQALAAKLTEEAETFLESFPIDPATLILGGREDRELLRYVREGAVELLVMGAYGHNRLREFLGGSTTTAIIRKSPVPVLLTR